MKPWKRLDASKKPKSTYIKTKVEDALILRQKIEEVNQLPKIMFLIRKTREKIEKNGLSEPLKHNICEASNSVGKIKA